MKKIHSIPCLLFIWSIVTLGACSNGDDDSGTTGPVTPPIPKEQPDYIPDNMSNPELDYNTICFYYNWYGNPEHDGGYIHWAHYIAPNPENSEETSPVLIPGDGNNIGADFFPELRTYSSTDREIVAKHMKMMSDAHIGVIALTWWATDKFVMKSVDMIMDEAAKVGMKVCMHIEPYDGRSVASVRDDLEKFVQKYRNHKAYYSVDGKPLVFVYNALDFNKNDWQSILSEDGSKTIRGTDIDAYFIGLIYDLNTEPERIASYDFDGVFTYFGAPAYCDGANPKNWERIQKWANQKKLAFIPCASPGYADLRIRPWNGAIQTPRRAGVQYEEAYQAAIDCASPFIGITSFNEWHEGTQIEPAIPMSIPGYTYNDYEGLAPDYYLKKTAEYILKYQESKK
ncbi:glycoprotein endo-alpha-1,2-mannosidase [Mariniphaga anaerophila]|uniref:Glycoprotein endo-alpha-1,2-mannosidase n=1 Tax=Mariniphaga anaerophila TaxID=1484053 RepID=A0A1M4SLD3_9BACT|nr:glycoside hydrolase family 99 protein [Mariniphaga anaerophila]SHE32787.1 glycoprotein endo-alpha-1,2-mannosidase [Mariniphaga anaerophila]